MESKIAKALGLQFQPVALLWRDQKPQGAAEFKKGKWGCVMWLLAGAARGRTGVVSAETYGCWGGGVGLGFGNQYLSFPGGLECFYRFLSTGNDSWDTGRAVAKELESRASREFLEDFLKGERYKKSPELVADFVQQMPFFQIPAKYVVFKPLNGVDRAEEEPKIVVLLASADQLAALIILANYRRKGFENVIVPYAAGCQTIGIFPYREAASPTPRAVLGLTDISARLNLVRQLPRNLFSMAVPWRMFQEMEMDVEASFLERKTWKKLSQESLLEHDF